MALDLPGSEGGAISPRGGKVAALLPAGQFGALWQISALQSGFVISGADRSGSALPCGDINPLGLPDLIPGERSFLPSGVLPSPQPLTRVTTPALKLQAELTLMFRFALLGYNIEGSYQYVASYANYADGSEAGAAQWAAVFAPSATQTVQLAYFAQSGPSKTAQLAYGAAAPVKDGLWHFGCIRRNADGSVVDVQVDATSTQTTGLSAPTGGTTAYPCLGWNTLATRAEGMHGLIADFNVWSVRLTDAQVATCRAIMMGL